MSQNITKTSDSNDHESQAWNTTLKASPPGWHRSDGFLEFSLFSFILGLDLTALIFWFFCIKTKEQLVIPLNQNKLNTDQMTKNHIIMT